MIYSFVWFDSSASRMSADHPDCVCLERIARQNVTLCLECQYAQYKALTYVRQRNAASQRLG